MTAGKELVIGDRGIAPGQRLTIDLPLTDLSTHTPLTLPVHIVHGKRAGPRVFVSAAIHGDEINGVEIIRQVLRMRSLDTLRGTLLAVPVVNVFGFIAHSRYLPDRRDLNRIFPGSATGSLAARLADLFMREVVLGSDLGIDLHTGAIHRANLPQLRANLDDPFVMEIATSFAPPVIINAATRAGSLRFAAGEADVPVLVFEGSEALRYDDHAIRTGVNGITRVLRHLKMLPPGGEERRRTAPVKRRTTLARSTTWARAPRSGVMRRMVELGANVTKGQRLAVIADPFGENEVRVNAHQAGIVIGLSNLPIVHEGDALFHIARVTGTKASVRSLEAYEDEPEQKRRRSKSRKAKPGAG
jgi:predicted deacylase